MGLMRRVLDRLHPPGSAWRIIGDLALLMDGIADGLASARAFIRAALAESLPLTATEMLPEWHAALGQRYDPTQTLEYQRRMLDAIWTAFGGVTLNQLNAQMHKELAAVDVSEIIETDTTAECGPGNLCDRGDCESATPPMVSGETVPVTFNATWVPDATEHYQGTQSYKFTKTSAVGTDSLVDLTDAVSTSDMHGFLPGQTVTYRLRIKLPIGSGLAGKARVQINDYAAAWQSTSDLAEAIYGDWQELTVTRVLRSASTGVTVRITTGTAAALNEYFYVDDIQIWDADAIPAECGLAETGSTLEGSEVNPFIYLVSGTVENDTEAARVIAVIQHFAPLHLTPTSSLIILSDSGIAECGVAVAGLAECASTG